MKKVKILKRNHTFLKKDFHIVTTTNTSREAETKTHTHYQVREMLKKSTVITVTINIKKPPNRTFGGTLPSLWFTRSEVRSHNRHHLVGTD